MTIINALLVMLSLLEKQIQFKNIPHKMVECIKDNSLSQYRQCEKDYICCAEIKCRIDYPLHITYNYVINCVNSDIYLGIISFGNCANRHSCFSDAF